jgi:hypothetical protein
VSSVAIESLNHRVIESLKLRDASSGNDPMIQSLNDPIRSLADNE